MVKGSVENYRLLHNWVMAQHMQCKNLWGVCGHWLCSGNSPHSSVCPLSPAAVSHKCWHLLLTYQWNPIIISISPVLKYYYLGCVVLLNGRYTQVTLDFMLHPLVLDFNFLFSFLTWTMGYLYINQTADTTWRNLSSEHLCDVFRASGITAVCTQISASSSSAVPLGFHASCSWNHSFYV